VETGTLAVATGSELKLGGTVTFDVTFSPDNLDKKNKGGVRVQIIANDPTTHDTIYAMARHYDEAFLLGGGWSPWLEQGGPAHCVASLYYWSYQGGGQQFNHLATIEFDAAGA